MNRGALVLALLLLISGAASAATFTEDFESFGVGETDPERSWYNFNQGPDQNATVNDTGPVIEGNQSLVMNGSKTGSLDGRAAFFNLVKGVQLDETTFTIKGEPPANVTGGSQQVVAIESTAPRRTLVEFYLFCSDDTNDTACQLRVRFDHADSTGQVLVNETLNQTEFQIRMVFNWPLAQYRLIVNGVDDGLFPFLELPNNIARFKLEQYRGDFRWGMGFDNWTVVGATNATQAATEGDVANGIKGFAQDIRFTSGGSKFFLGILLFAIMVAAVVVPLISVGRDNSTLPAVSFFAILAALWLVTMEFWPDWLGIAMIILAAAILSSTVRRVALGISDASSGAGLVAGSLGYFIIASVFLAFSGYATDTITLPTSPAEQQSDSGANVTGTNQTFVGAVTECIFSGGVFTFGLVGDCSQETTTTTWKKITDAAGQIYGWVQAGMDFVFQLLTFRMPIPTIFNLMIVGPPAAALGAYGIGVIRGVSS